MKSRFFSIWSVVLVLVISFAVFIPGCEGEPATATIEIKACFCGDDWQGAINYTLTPTEGTPISGTRVPNSFTVTPGTWSFDYVSGGPPDALFEGGIWWSPDLEEWSVDVLGPVLVDPFAHLSATIEFVIFNDAVIEFLHWTRSGEILQGAEIYEVFAEPCNTIDTHFRQWVPTCFNITTMMNEAAYLTITQVGGLPAQIVVVDDWCAVTKTPAPREKVFQSPSIDGEIVETGQNITLTPEIPIELGVHTQWELEGYVDYTKDINWFGIVVGEYDPGAHPCVLFELVLPVPGFFYIFELQTSAEITLVGANDPKLDNNQDTSEPITLVVDLVS